jgi:hypothetical protein
MNKDSYPYPILVKETCEKNDYHRKNWAENPNRCDLNQNSCHHRTISDKGVALDKRIVALHHGIQVVIYENGMLVNLLYADITYKEVIIIHHPDNTIKLNIPIKSEKYSIISLYG